MYDPEASIQDADLEMLELAAAGNQIARYAKRHGCACQSVQGFGALTCSGCGRIFPSEAAWFAFLDEVGS